MVRGALSERRLRFVWRYAYSLPSDLNSELRTRVGSAKRANRRRIPRVLLAGTMALMSLEAPNGRGFPGLEVVLV